MSTCFRKVQSMAVPIVKVSHRLNSTWPPSLHRRSAAMMYSESSVIPSPCDWTTQTLSRPAGVGHLTRALYGDACIHGLSDISCAVMAAVKDSTTKKENACLILHFPGWVAWKGPWGWYSRFPKYHLIIKQSQCKHALRTRAKGKIQLGRVKSDNLLPLYLSLRSFIVIRQPQNDIHGLSPFTDLPGWIIRGLTHCTTFPHLKAGRNC